VWLVSVWYCSLPLTERTKRMKRGFILHPFRAVCSYFGFVKYSLYVDFSLKPQQPEALFYVLLIVLLIHNFISLDYTLLVYVLSCFDTNVHSTLNVITG